MNKVARTLLPLFFGLASLGLGGCADPIGSVHGDEGSSEETSDSPEATEVTSKITGSVGTALGRVHGDSEMPVAQTPMSTAVTELVIPGPSPTVLEVLSYEFGIENTLSLGAATGGAGAGKAELKPLKVSVRPGKPGTTSLVKQLLIGQSIDKVVLRQRVQGAKGEVTSDFATFETTAVTSMRTGISGGTIDEYEIHVGIVTLNQPSGPVGHDKIKNLPFAPPACGRGSDAKLGPYVQADPSWKLPVGSVRIERAEVLVTNDTTVGSGTSGAQGGKPTLEHVLVDGPMDPSGACAFFYTALGASIPVVRIDAASSVDLKTGALVIDQTWETCGAAVQEVVFSGDSNDGMPRQHISMQAQGVVRTDRSGAAGAKPTLTVNGWSFTENKAITACPKP